jgi:hypothetical protein
MATGSQQYVNCVVMSCVVFGGGPGGSPAAAQQSGFTDRGRRAWLTPSIARKRPTCMRHRTPCVFLSSPVIYLFLPVLITLTQRSFPDIMRTFQTGLYLRYLLFNSPTGRAIKLYLGRPHDDRRRTGYQTGTIITMLITSNHLFSETLLIYVL